MLDSLRWILSLVLVVWAVNGNENPAAEENLENLNLWWNLTSQSYPKYEATTSLLRGLEEAYPNLVKIYSIGTSLQVREMWMINVRKDVKKERKLLRPKVKIVANMHGDEAVGRALVLMLAVDLVKRFNEDDTRVVNLLTYTDIHLMPSMNPDGFEAAVEGDCSPSPFQIGRLNANGTDLNRDFPDLLEPSLVLPMAPHGNAVETRNMMKFIEEDYDFVLSANLHGGSLVASYPFDSVPLDVENNTSYKGSGVESLTSDNDVFVYLAKLYASNHKTMALAEHQCPGAQFPEGITNGAAWFNVRGGMQDFSYIRSNSFEITLELSCCKYPPASTLLHEWDLNQEALYKFMEAAQMGVRGVVKDSRRKPVQGLLIQIDTPGERRSVVTNSRGEYWRPLLPGSYNRSFQDPGRQIPSTWTNVAVYSNLMTVVNITLRYHQKSEAVSIKPDAVISLVLISVVVAGLM